MLYALLKSFFYHLSLLCICGHNHLCRPFLLRVFRPLVLIVKGRLKFLSDGVRLLQDI